MHEGICEDHGGGRSLAHKIIRQCYFFTIMHENAREFIWRCHKYQKFIIITRQPIENMIVMSNTWPFAQ